ncbi:MAG: hypothetical protein ACE5DX_04945 [Candidatus Dojkabacteria bacterium]
MSRKLSNTFKKLISQVQRRVGKIEIRYSDLFVKFFMLLVILTLGYNIYTAYSKGQTNLKRIESEEAKLEKLQAEAERLDGEIDYYSSIEYRRSYARDSWNLAEPGAELFFVNRPEQHEIESIKFNKDPIPLYNNSLWWKKLILGG